MIGRIPSLILSSKTVPQKKQLEAAKFNCRFCPNTYKDENGRKCHERDAHTLTCEECKVKFATVKDLHVHTKSGHNVFGGMIVPEVQK